MTSSPPFTARVTFTRKRRDGGAYVDGRYTGETTTDEDFIGSIQPPTSRRGHDFLQELPEAQRTRDVIVVYTDFNVLRTANEGSNTLADRVLFNGKTFEVQRINTWATQVLTHDQAYCVRLDND